MTTFLKRIAVRKKGMEALQAVLIAVVGFFIVSALKDLGKQGSQGAQQQSGSILGNLLGGAGSAVGNAVGGIFPF